MVELFAQATNIHVRALYLGERLDVRALESTGKLGTAPLTLAAGERGCAVLFRYGAVVLFHVAPLEEAGLVEQLRRYVGEPFAKPEIEEVDLRVHAERTDVVESGGILVAALSLERVQIVAEILARAVALTRYESVVRDTFAAIEPWAQSLHAHGSGGQLETNLLKNLGSTMLIQHSMAGRVEIDDKPELLWERPDLERLYAKLEDGTRVYATFDARQVGDDRLSSVQYLKLDTHGRVPVALGVDHHALQSETALSDEVREALREDLRSDW